MSHVRFLAWYALMANSVLAMGTATAADGGIFEVDLISPRNMTYTPQALMPIVFALQHPALSYTTAASIFWSVWEGNNQTSPGSVTDGGLELALDDWNQTSSEPHFVTRFFNTINYPEGFWTLSWSLQLYNCSDNPEKQGVQFITTNNTTTFTVSRQSGKAPDLVAATSSETCGATVAYAYNVTGGEYGCGFMGPNVTANPCSATINSSAASSIMAAATEMACSPSESGVYPNVSCPASPLKSSNDAGPSHMAAAVSTWLTLLTLVTALIHLR
ncbi:uncharacterized protein BO97DRAFT_469865 [Aspergillus homomorphus CBS 101889]|uniref:DUF7136 domain-containing protein n=1 Tax=Aspergillus homomorphus (strain CBS 101889) TaxID=1450537 RepID=A0A395HYV8_ASPHC|nr:hypothetical protein BO97DRAFT_469865 [Aspergillus homomorphus CBS 101889]RAL13111.1 hypothetical protein BO97DRAFT_469865 [Aspergillus homomorphus CBS 101889]